MKTRYEYRATFAFHAADGSDNGKGGWGDRRTRIYRQRAAMVSALGRWMRPHAFEDCPRREAGYYRRCFGWVARVERRAINPWETTTFEEAGLV